MHTCALQDRWVALQNAEWVVPLTVVTRESGVPVWYLLRKAPGDTLLSMVRSFCPESFPLPDVIGRVALCKLQAETSRRNISDDRAFWECNGLRRRLPESSLRISYRR